MIVTSSYQKETRGLSMTSLEIRSYHRAFGAHSKIPACCIEFFINEWDRGEWWQNEGNWYRQAVDAAGFGYVPCPKCLGMRNKVKIKLCDEECGGDHHRDFKLPGVLNAR